MRGTYQVHGRLRDGRVLVPVVDHGYAQPTQAREKPHGTHEHRDALERCNLEAAQRLLTHVRQRLERVRPRTRYRARSEQHRLARARAPPGQR